MGLIPNIDVKSSAERLEAKLDRITYLLEMALTAQLQYQGLTTAEIVNIVCPPSKGG